MNARTRPDLILRCRVCKGVTVLDANEQERILSELQRRSEVKVVECRCGMFQFALAAKPTYAPAARQTQSSARAGEGA